MNTLTKTTEANLSIELAKSIALKKHLGEDFFIFIDDDNEVFVFEGNEAEARENFKNNPSGCNFLEYCSMNLILVEDYNVDDYNNDYLVLTDEEADEKSKEYILDSVWAFTPSFLSSFTGFDIEVFEAIQNNGRCESNNSAILSMIEDEAGFVSDAISCDGRGHFLAMYDGNENEEEVNGQTFYIYRIN